MSTRFMDPLDDKKNSVKYDKKTINFDYMKEVLAANQLFSKNDIQRYNKFSRYGYADPYNIDQVSREFLFFTKPDLNLFSSSDGNGGPTGYDSDLIPYLQTIPFFSEANKRYKDAIRQLQYSVRDSNGVLNPFMYLLSNTVTSKLDLPSITSDSREVTSNLLGVTMQYRGHSFKSDAGYDFSLSFTDTAKLEVYTMVKIYDEYIRLLKLGEIAPIHKYITNRIASEQFSIYKFLIGADGETILFYSKLTGCYFTDVPRSDLADPGNDGFKFSLSFHAQFVEDNNPMILEEFNRISPGGKKTDYIDAYNYDAKAVSNDWVRWPKIITVNKVSDKQVERRGTDHDYRMKWIK